MNPVFGDVHANIRLLETEYASVWATHQLIVLPELASTGYRFSSREEAWSCAEPVSCSNYLNYLIEKASGYCCYIVTGFCERDQDELFNSSVLIGPNGIIGIYRKLHLFREEKLIFKPGNRGIDVYPTPIGKIGMLICFDWMFPEVWRMLLLKGAELVCHPSNLVLPFCQRVVPTYALVNRYVVVTANRVGVESDLRFTGQSLICNAIGEEIARGNLHDPEVVSGRVDPNDAVDKWITSLNHIVDDRRSDVYGNYLLT